jgi:hypothetical protein
MKKERKKKTKNERMEKERERNDWNKRTENERMEQKNGKMKEWNLLSAGKHID